MKRMNEHENKPLSLKEKVLHELGNRLASMVVEPMACRIFTFYEPKLPLELLKELVDED